MCSRPSRVGKRAADHDAPCWVAQHQQARTPSRPAQRSRNHRGQGNAHPQPRGAQTPTTSKGGILFFIRSSARGVRRLGGHTRGPLREQMIHKWDNSHAPRNSRSTTPRARHHIFLGIFLKTRRFQRCTATPATAARHTHKHAQYVDTGSGQTDRHTHAQMAERVFSHFLKRDTLPAQTKKKITASEQQPVGTHATTNTCTHTRAAEPSSPSGTHHSSHAAQPTPSTNAAALAHSPATAEEEERAPTPRMATQPQAITPQTASTTQSPRRPLRERPCRWMIRG